MGKAIIVDGNSIIYRAYYGHKPPRDEEEITDEDVQRYKVLVVNTVRGICYSLLKQSGFCKYCVMVFDSSKETFRKKKNKEYKSNRPSMPKVLHESLEDIRITIENMGFNILPAPKNYEADDVICTLCKKFSQAKIKNDVYSSDNDMLQIVSYYTTVFICKMGGVKMENNFRNFRDLHDGLSPFQIPHLKAISGDSSDNYRGVKGVGDKVATKLLNRYGSIDMIYRNIMKLTKKNMEAFNNQKDNLYECLDLATTRDNVDIIFDENNFINRKKK